MQNSKRKRAARRPTASKAKQMLKDNSAQGHPLTGKQKKFFGYIAGSKKRAAVAQPRQGKTPVIGSPMKVDVSSIQNPSWVSKGEFKPMVSIPKGQTIGSPLQTPYTPSKNPSWVKSTSKLKRAMKGHKR